MNYEKNKNIEILLVEDNPGDIRLTKEALSEARIINSLSIARDGNEAIKILKQLPGYENFPRPDLILLDLNMPKKTGFEVLAEIKSDEKLKTIPVIVLTTSESEQDIIKSYKLYANAYITKPIEIQQFISIFKTIGDFWFSIVKFPKENKQ